MWIKWNYILNFFHPKNHFILDSNSSQLWEFISHQWFIEEIVFLIGKNEKLFKYSCRERKWNFLSSPSPLLYTSNIRSVPFSILPRELLGIITRIILMFLSFSNEILWSEKRLFKFDFSHIFHFIYRFSCSSCSQDISVELFMKNFVFPLTAAAKTSYKYILIAEEFKRT